MRVSRESSSVQVELAREESLILARILESVREQYQIPPAELDPKSARAWYDTRGCADSGMAERDVGEWVNQLHQFKSQNLKSIEQWIGLLGQPSTDTVLLTLPLDQVITFLQVLNDHRLLLTARNDLGEEELNPLSFQKTLESLDPQGQLALCEVNLLGYLMECILGVLPGFEEGPDESAELND